MMSQTTATKHTSRIAVAGATGRVGATLTALLASDDIEVSALTRDPDTARVPEGVLKIKVDFDQAQTLRDALRGADRLFISQGTSGRQVVNEIALIDAAVAAGVRHVVKLSALGPATRLLPFAWHRQIEAHLADQPIASTVLRPSAFSYLFRRVGAQVANGSWTGAAGDGRVNFIDPRDVAEVARVALIQDIEPDSQRAFHITGDRAWTMHQVADELARLLERPVAYVNRTPDQQRASLLEAGMPPFVTELLIGLDQIFRESSLGETTTTFEELTGKAPRSLTAWLTENLAAFEP